MYEAAEEGAGGQDDGAGSVGLARCPQHSVDGAILAGDQVLDAIGNNGQVRLLGQQRLDRLAIELPVRLRPGAANRRSLAPVEHPELDSGGVDRPAHDSVQGVDLPDQVSLGQAADGWIAGHFADLGGIMGQQQGTGAHPGGGRGCLGPGVPAADNNDVPVLHGGEI